MFIKIWLDMNVNCMSIHICLTRSLKNPYQGFINIASYQCIMYYLQNEWRSLSVYKDTSALHEYLCTLIKNGHEFCKLLTKRT